MDHSLSCFNSRERWRWWVHPFWYALLTNPEYQHRYYYSSIRELYQSDMVRKGTRALNKRACVVPPALPTVEATPPAITYGGTSVSGPGGIHHHHHPYGNGIMGGSGGGPGPKLVVASSSSSVSTDDETCPQCGVAFNTTNFRKLQEECGHYQCRNCVLNSERCKLCFKEGSVIVEEVATPPQLNHNHSRSVNTRRSAAAAAARLQSATNSRANSINSVRPTSSSPGSTSNDTGRQSSSVYSDSADSDSCLRFPTSVIGTGGGVVEVNDGYAATIDFETMAELTSPTLVETGYMGLSEFSSAVDSKSYSSIVSEENEFSKSLMSLRKMADPNLNNNHNNGSRTSPVSLGTNSHRGLVTRAQLKEMPSLSVVTIGGSTATSQPFSNQSSSSPSGSSSRLSGSSKRRSKDSPAVLVEVGSNGGSGSGSPDITQQPVPKDLPRNCRLASKDNSPPIEFGNSRLSALLRSGSTQKNSRASAGAEQDSQAKATPATHSTRESGEKEIPGEVASESSKTTTISAPSSPEVKKELEPVPSPPEASNSAEEVEQNNDEGEQNNEEEEDPLAEKEPVPKKKKKRSPVVIHDHITILGGEPPMYQCNLCNKKFKTKAHIKYHEFCQKGDKPFKCETCGQGFIAKSHYEYHIRTHTGERPYTCPKCGKGFNQQGKVTRHMRSHTGEKPFVCQECNRGFANAQALRCHTLIHTGERPFACTYCNKRFTGMTNLKKHVITHTGERPFSCTHCGKSFGLKWTLDLHLRTHSTERPYACDQCTRAFSNSKDLRRHLVIHSGERPFKCWLCGTAFRRKDNLDRHIKNTHNQSREVAKQLANEAAAEYLKNNSKNQSLGNIPVSKVNSIVISNIIKNNDLMPAGGLGPNKFKGVSVDGVGGSGSGSNSNVSAQRHLQPKPAVIKVSSPPAKAASPIKVEGKSATSTSTPSSVQQAKPSPSTTTTNSSRQRKVIITAPLSPPTTRAGKSKQTDLTSPSKAISPKKGKSSPKVKKKAPVPAVTTSSQPTSKSGPEPLQVVVLPPPPPPVEVSNESVKKSKRKSKKKKKSKSKSSQREVEQHREVKRQERVRAPPSPPIQVEFSTKRFSRRRNSGGSKQQEARGEEEERESALTPQPPPSPPPPKETPTLSFFNVERRPILTLVTPHSPKVEERGGMPTTASSSDIEEVGEKQTGEKDCSHEEEVQVENDSEKGKEDTVECILPHDISEMDEGMSHEPELGDSTLAVINNELKVDSQYDQEDVAQDSMEEKTEQGEQTVEERTPLANKRISAVEELPPVSSQPPEQLFDDEDEDECEEPDFESERGEAAQNSAKDTSEIDTSPITEAATEMEVDKPCGEFEEAQSDDELSDVSSGSFPSSPPPELPEDEEIAANPAETGALDAELSEGELSPNEDDEETSTGPTLSSSAPLIEPTSPALCVITMTSTVALPTTVATTPDRPPSPLQATTPVDTEEIVKSAPCSPAENVLTHVDSESCEKKLELDSGENETEELLEQEIQEVEESSRMAVEDESMDDDEIAVPESSSKDAVSSVEESVEDQLAEEEDEIDVEIAVPQPSSKDAVSSVEEPVEDQLAEEEDEIDVEIAVPQPSSKDAVSSVEESVEEELAEEEEEKMDVEIAVPQPSPKDAVSSVEESVEEELAEEEEEKMDVEIAVPQPSPKDAVSSVEESVEDELTVEEGEIDVQIAVPQPSPKDAVSSVEEPVEDQLAEEEEEKMDVEIAVPQPSPKDAVSSVEESVEKEFTEEEEEKMDVEIAVPQPSSKDAVTSVEESVEDQLAEEEDEIDVEIAVPQPSPKDAVSSVEEPVEDQLTVEEEEIDVEIAVPQPSPKDAVSSVEEPVEDQLAEEEEEKMDVEIAVPQPSPKDAVSSVQEPVEDQLAEEEEEIDVEIAVPQPSPKDAVSSVEEPVEDELTVEEEEIDVEIAVPQPSPKDAVSSVEEPVEDELTVEEEEIDVEIAVPQPSPKDAVSSVEESVEDQLAVEEDALMESNNDADVNEAASDLLSDNQPKDNAEELDSSLVDDPITISKQIEEETTDETESPEVADFAPLDERVSSPDSPETLQTIEMECDVPSPRLAIVPNDSPLPASTENEKQGESIRMTTNFTETRHSTWNQLSGSTNKSFSLDRSAMEWEVRTPRLILVSHDSPPPSAAHRASSEDEEEQVEKEDPSVVMDVNADDPEEDDDDDDEDRLYVDESYVTPNVDSVKSIIEHGPDSLNSMSEVKAVDDEHVNSPSSPQPPSPSLKETCSPAPITTTMISAPEEATPSSLVDKEAEETEKEEEEGEESSSTASKTSTVAPASPKTQNSTSLTSTEVQLGIVPTTPPRTPSPTQPPPPVVAVPVDPDDENSRSEATLPQDISDFVLSVLENKSRGSGAWKADDLESISSESLASPQSDVENSIKMCIQTLESDPEEDGAPSIPTPNIQRNGASLAMSLGPLPMPASMSSSNSSRTTTVTSSCLLPVSKPESKVPSPKSPEMRSEPMKPTLESSSPPPSLEESQVSPAPTGSPAPNLPKNGIAPASPDQPPMQKSGNTSPALSNVEPEPQKFPSPAKLPLVPEYKLPPMVPQEEVAPTTAVQALEKSVEMTASVPLPKISPPTNMNTKPVMAAQSRITTAPPTSTDCSATVSFATTIPPVMKTIESRMPSPPAVVSISSPSVMLRPVVPATPARSQNIRPNGLVPQLSLVSHRSTIQYPVPEELAARAGEKRGREELYQALPTRVQFLLPKEQQHQSIQLQPDQQLVSVGTEQQQQQQQQQQLSCAPVAYDPSLLSFMQPNGQQALEGNYQIVYAAAAATAERDEGVLDGPPNKVRLLYAEALGVGSSPQNGDELQFYYTATTPDQQVQHTSTPCHVQLMEPYRVTYSRTADNATSEMLQYQVQQQAQPYQQPQSTSTLNSQQVLNLSVNSSPVYYYSTQNNFEQQQQQSSSNPPQQQIPFEQQQGTYYNTSTAKLIVANQAAYNSVGAPHQAEQHERHHSHVRNGEAQDLSGRKRLELPVQMAHNNKITYAHVQSQDPNRYADLLGKARQMKHVFPEGAFKHCNSYQEYRSSGASHHHPYHQTSTMNGMHTAGFSNDSRGNGASGSGAPKLSGLDLLSAASLSINQLQDETHRTHAAAAAIAAAGEMARRSRLGGQQQEGEREVAAPRPSLTNVSHSNFPMSHQNNVSAPYNPQQQLQQQQQQQQQMVRMGAPLPGQQFLSQHHQPLQGHQQYLSPQQPPLPHPHHLHPQVGGLEVVGNVAEVDQEAGIRRGPRKYYLSRSAHLRN